MSEDSNRNATASWSRFSHQGQVGLLIALRELQKNGVDKDRTFVQFEKHEDVANYEEDENGVKRSFMFAALVQKKIWQSTFKIPVMMLLPQQKFGSEKTM